MTPTQKTWLLRAALAALLLAAAGLAWLRLQPGGPGPGFASGNGRIEATEVDIATKQPGRIEQVLVDEGDFIQAGQVVARMDTRTLQAQHAQALAQLRQAQSAAATAEAMVAQRQSDAAAAAAALLQRQAERDVSGKELARARALLAERASSQQEVDNDEARDRSAQAAVDAARAQIGAAQAAVRAARSQVVEAGAAIEAAQASLSQLQSELDDAVLKAPRAGRVQYRIAQPGEVLSGGGKLLSTVDLGEVYMSFFLPETVAGRVALGSEAHLVLDAAPDYVFPARISYVASVAQFTPKTVETANERQKLMFRVKARVDEAVLARYLTEVKTGLPGVAWVRLDPRTPWPAQLQTRLPQP